VSLIQLQGSQRHRRRDLARSLFQARIPPNQDLFLKTPQGWDPPNILPTLIDWHHRSPPRKVPALQALLQNRQELQLPRKKIVFIVGVVPSYIIPSFATLEPPNAIANAKPGTELWLWDRLTIRVSRIPFTLDQDDSKTEINEKIKDYDDIMKMVIRRQWNELVSNCIPLMFLFS
jgi:hypothetical protein